MSKLAEEIRSNVKQFKSKQLPKNKKHLSNKRKDELNINIDVNEEKEIAQDYHKLKTSVDDYETRLTNLDKIKDQLTKDRYNQFEGV